MIVCPRCGYQAPDGSPWCPRCGYGCPHPLPPQQIPPQMPPQQQLQPIYMPQPQYQNPQKTLQQFDVYDLPPQPDQHQQKQQPPKRKNNRRKKKKHVFFKKLSMGCAIIFLLFVGFIVLVLSSDTGTNSEKQTKNAIVTPQNAETMVKQIMDQTETAVLSAILSATPTFTQQPTDTSTPTNTSIPTGTPYPTYTPVPSDTSISTADWSSDQTYLDNSYGQSGGGVLGSVSQPDTASRTCNINGNVSTRNGNKKIYHCPNWRDYDKTQVNYDEGDQWFCSEEEALAAGFNKPGNVSAPCIQ